MKIAIENGHLVDPANHVDRVCSLYIDNSRVVGVGTAPPGFIANRIVDARDRLVIPGLIDLSARLGEPGFEYKADIDSESEAAVSAGITTLCCPPDTDPVIDTPAGIEFIERRRESVDRSRIYVYAALTQGLAGDQLTEMANLKAAGCIAVTNLGQPFRSARVARQALEYAASHDLTVLIYPEDTELAAGGCAHEGSVATRLGLPFVPEAAETSAIGFFLPLIEKADVRAHFCRLSTLKGMNMIRRAKHDGLRVTADVAAHQLFLTEVDIADFNSLCHTRPPLRSQRDRDGLRQGLTQFGIDAICSDHQPHELDAKLAPFRETEPGISALETLLPLTLRLVDEHVLTLSEAIALVTSRPAAILGLPLGRLGIGDLADLCIIDPRAEYECDPQQFYSKGKNSPLGGWMLRGRVTHTLVDGRFVWEL